MELRKWLKQFPATEELAGLYQKWRRKYYSLQKYPLPKELIEFLHTRQPENFTLQDEILHSLITECKSNAGSRMTTIYLFLGLFSFLEIVFHYWRKMLFRYGIYDDEIWNEIWSAFHKTLSDYELDNHREKIGFYFQGAVGNMMKKWYRKMAKQWKSETGFNDDLLIPDDRHVFQLPINELSGEDIADMEQILEELVARGIIDSLGKTLIAETRLHKKPLQNTAKKLGLSYDAARRKRRRTELKISKNLKKSEI